MNCKGSLRTSVAALLALAMLQAVPLRLAAQKDYLVGARDVLTILIFGRPELSGKFSVDPEGAVALPLIERVKVAGMSARAIEEELKKRYADGYLKDPQVTVTVEEYHSQQVFVQGAVRQPGPYPLTGGTTLFEVLTRAGYVTAEAGNEVLVVRQPPRVAGASPAAAAAAAAAGEPVEIQRVDLGALQSGSLAQAVALQDGDTIVVPVGEKVFITGHVATPGAYTVRQGTTLRQALSLAGGVTDRGAVSRIKIMRRVNGKESKTGAKLDDIVRPGDTIVVPERFF